MTLLEQKFPVFKGNHRLAVFSSVSLVTLIFGLLLFTATYLLPSAPIAKAKEVEWTPPKGDAILEVHIANNGLVFLQGARVESISGTTLVVSTSWNSTKLEWTIQTNASGYGKRHFGTNFLDSKGVMVTLDNVHVGDVVSISGNLDLISSGLVVKADVVRI